MTKNKSLITIDVDDTSLRERSEELTLLMELGDVFARVRNLDDLLQDSLAWLMKSFDLDAGRVYLLEEDEEGEYLSLAAVEGIDPQGLIRVELGQGFTGQSATLRQLIAHKVTEMDDPERVAFLQSKGLVSVICVPLIANRMVVGVLNLAARRRLRLDRRQIDLLILCGHRIAVVILNTKLYEELEEQARILKEQMETLTFFSNTAYHDLKSPVVGIHGLASRLLNKHSQGLDVRGVLCAQQIQRAAERLVELVGEINEFIKARHTTHRLVELELRDVVGEVRETYAEAMAERGVIWQEPPRLPRLRAEKMGLIRALENLVDNALKYGGQDMSLIRLGLEEQEDEYVLSVYDNGSNVAQVDLERIFSPFQRTTASQGQEGSGLGLAIVAEVARRHGGKAWATSSPDQGITFHLSLSKNPG